MPVSLHRISSSNDSISMANLAVYFAAGKNKTRPWRAGCCVYLTEQSFMSDIDKMSPGLFFFAEQINKHQDQAKYCDQDRNDQQGH